MSDTEEHGQEEVAEEYNSEQPAVTVPPPTILMPEVEALEEDSQEPQATPEPPPPSEGSVIQESEEGLSYIEDLHRKKTEHLQQEMDEYEAARKEEKQKEADEIANLKKKREERAKERVEEEKRMAEQRKEEEVRRKAEEEERKKRKAEEEAKRKAEKERRRKEAEARAGPKTPNFTIVKKERSGAGDDEDDKPPQKSKEELEKEKQAVLAQRIQPLQSDGMDTAKLKEYAQNLHDKMRQLVSNKYDLEERFKRQQYDMTELRERARQMSKVKKRGVTAVQVDDAFDPNAERFTNAPPKILVASKFERNLDRRTWGEKLTCYSSKQDYDITYKPFYAFNFTFIFSSEPPETFPHLQFCVQPLRSSWF